MYNDDVILTVLIILVFIVGGALGFNLGEDYLKQRLVESDCFLQNKIVYCK